MEVVDDAVKRLSYYNGFGFPSTITCHKTGGCRNEPDDDIVLYSNLELEQLNNRSVEIISDKRFNLLKTVSKQYDENYIYQVYAKEELFRLDRNYSLRGIPLIEALHFVSIFKINKMLILNSLDYELVTTINYYLRCNQQDEIKDVNFIGVDPAEETDLVRCETPDFFTNLHLSNWRLGAYQNGDIANMSNLKSLVNRYKEQPRDLIFCSNSNYQMYSLIPETCQKFLQVQVSAAWLSYNCITTNGFFICEFTLPCSTEAFTLCALCHFLFCTVQIFKPKSSSTLDFTFYLICSKPRKLPNCCSHFFMKMHSQCASKEYLAALKFLKQFSQAYSETIIPYVKEYFAFFDKISSLKESNDSQVSDIYFEIYKNASSFFSTLNLSPFIHYDSFNDPLITVHKNLLAEKNTCAYYKLKVGNVTLKEYRNKLLENQATYGSAFMFVISRNHNFKNSGFHRILSYSITQNIHSTYSFELLSDEVQKLKELLVNYGVANSNYPIYSPLTSLSKYMFSYFLSNEKLCSLLFMLCSLPPKICLYTLMDWFEFHNQPSNFLDAIDCLMSLSSALTVESEYFNFPFLVIEEGVEVFKTLYKHNKTGYCIDYGKTATVDQSIPNDSYFHSPRFTDIASVSKNFESKCTQSVFNIFIVFNGFHFREAFQNDLYYNKHLIKAVKIALKIISIKGSLVIKLPASLTRTVYSLLVLLRLLFANIKCETCLFQKSCITQILITCTNYQKSELTLPIYQLITQAINVTDSEQAKERRLRITSLLPLVFSNCWSRNGFATFNESVFQSQLNTLAQVAKTMQKFNYINEIYKNNGSINIVWNNDCNNINNLPEFLQMHSTILKSKAQTIINKLKELFLDGPIVRLSDYIYKLKNGNSKTRLALQELKLNSLGYFDLVTKDNLVTCDFSVSDDNTIGDSFYAKWGFSLINKLANNKNANVRWQNLKEFESKKKINNDIPFNDILIHATSFD